ncbi:MAG: rod shape-determining protein RodA [Alphaproteobacteria bacterium]
MYSRQRSSSLYDKINKFSFSLFWGVVALCGVSILMLYSVGVVPCEVANCKPSFGNWFPFASKQSIRFGIGFALFFILAFSSLKKLTKYAYILYGLNIFLLFVVSIVGHTGMGAQRWISIGGFIFQPSEPMKITLVLALSQFFSNMDSKEMKKLKTFFIGLAFVLVPFLLVLSQPDLGTALILAMLGGIMFLISGFPLSRFGVILLTLGLSLPMIWNFGLRDYQKQRIMTFVQPSKDTAGASYHITQAKIALGSGGWTGDGYLQGSQSHLNFLPEKQTDFIFVMFAEEFGFLGSFGLLILYLYVFVICFFIAMRARSRFSNLLGIGLLSNFALYFFINIAMVTGIIPVVGVPLPLISYGGSSALALLIGFGIIQSIAINKDNLN